MVDFRLFRRQWDRRHDPLRQLPRICTPGAAFARLRLAMRRFDESLAGDILAGLAFAVFAVGVIWVGAFLDYLGVLQ